MNLKFLPFESITFKTSLNENQLKSKLIESRAYEGEITEQYFKVERKINYNNSFLPKIKGEFDRDFSGTTIRIKMRLSIFVIIFLLFVYAFIGFYLYLILTNHNHKSHIAALAINLIGAIFPYAITMAGFKFETSKAKRELQEIFKAEIIMD